MRRRGYSCFVHTRSTTPSGSTVQCTEMLVPGTVAESSTVSCFLLLISARNFSEATSFPISRTSALPGARGEARVRADTRRAVLHLGGRRREDVDQRSALSH